MKKINDFTSVKKLIETKSTRIFITIEHMLSGEYNIVAEARGKGTGRWLIGYKYAEERYTDVDEAIDKFNELCKRYSDEKGKLRWDK